MTLHHTLKRDMPKYQSIVAITQGMGLLEAVRPLAQQGRLEGESTRVATIDMALRRSKINR
jgi:hypothetical protein